MTSAIGRLSVAPPAACPVEVVMAPLWPPTLFRQAFHIKGNADLRWVSLTYGAQVF